MAADFDMAVMQQQVATSGATQDFTISGFGTPTAALFIMGRPESDSGNWFLDALSLGMTDGTQEYCMGHQVYNNLTTSDTARRFDNDRVLQYFSTTGIQYGAASFNSWITDGVRLNLDDAFIYSFLVTVVLFKGSDLDVVVHAVNMGTSTSEQTYNSAGFEPQAVIGMMTGDSSYGHNDDVENAIGFAGLRPDDGTLDQFGTYIYSEDGVSTTNNKEHYESGKFLAANFGTVTINSFESDGFKYQCSASAGSGIMAFMCLAIGDKGRITLNPDEDTPGSASVYSYDSRGRKDGLLILGTDRLSPSGTTVTTNCYGLTIGAAGDHGGTAACHSWANEDGVSTSDCQSRTESGKIIRQVYDHGDTIGYASDAPPADDVVKFNWAVPDAANYDFAFLAFSDDVTMITPIGQPVEDDEVFTIVYLQRIQIGQATETNTALVTPKRLDLPQLTETDTAQSIGYFKKEVISRGTELDESYSMRDPTIIAVGQALETSTVYGIGLGKSIGQATEVNQAFWVYQALGIPQETNAAHAIEPQRAYEVFFGLETDVAFDVAATQPPKIRTPEELDTAFAINPDKSAVVGRVDETDVSQTHIAQHVYALTQINELDTAIPLDHATLLDLLVELDTAFSIEGGKTYTIGQLNETDVAFTSNPLLSRVVGQPSELDLAHKLDRHSRVYSIDETLSTEQAFNYNPGRGALLGQAVEAAEAFQFSTNRFAVGQSQEVAAALAFSVRRNHPGLVGQVLESDLGLSVELLRHYSLGQSVSTELAQAVTPIGRVLLLQLTESNTVFSFGRVKNRVFGQVNEDVVVRPFTSFRVKGINQTTESDSAFAHSWVKRRSIGQSPEVDSSSAFASSKRWAIGQMTEVDSSFPFTMSKDSTLGLSAEVDFAFALAMDRTLALEQAIEVDLAHYFIGVSPFGDFDILLPVTWVGSNALQVWGFHNVERQVNAELN